MKIEVSEKIVLLTIIAERKQKDALLTALLEAGMRLVNTAYGKGTVKASYLQTTLGLVPEKAKAIIICASTETKAETVLQMLIKDFHFDRPNTGIAFTISIDKVSF